MDKLGKSYSGKFLFLSLLGPVRPLFSDSMLSSSLEFMLSDTNMNLSLVELRP